VKIDAGLAGKTVIVTGGSRGIGRAIVELLADEGSDVTFFYRGNVDAANDVVAAARGASRKVAADQVDVRDSAACAAAVERVAERCGRIDVLVNNAGWDRASLFVVSDPADWDRVIAINLYGVLNTCKAVLPILAAQGHGSVVNLGSDAGRVGASGGAVNSAAKGGVIAFTKAIAREMARYQVNVNCVCPGPTDTALFASTFGDNPKLREALNKATPFHRLAQPDDIANAVAFYASDEASFITGQTVSVSGGLTMS
jgi:2-hydroxycyclohexanecarboxyl-CoA dehydrogenase